MRSDPERRVLAVPRAQAVSRPRRYRRRAEAKAENRRDLTECSRLVEERFAGAAAFEAPTRKTVGRDIRSLSRQLFESKVLLPAVPSLKTMVEQLSVWNMFEPIAHPLAEIYEDLYGSLCEDLICFPARR